MWTGAPARCGHHTAGSLYAFRELQDFVSPTGADSLALTPHSLRERRRLTARSSRTVMSRVAGGRRFAGARTPFASRTGPGSLLTSLPGLHANRAVEAYH